MTGSRHVLQNSTLEKYSSYAEADISACLKDMMVLIKPENGSGRKSNLQAVKKKFSSSRFGEVAKLATPEV